MNIEKNSLELLAYSLEGKKYLFLLFRILIVTSICICLPLFYQSNNRSDWFGFNHFEHIKRCNSTNRNCMKFKPQMKGSFVSSSVFNLFIRNLDQIIARFIIIETSQWTFEMKMLESFHNTDRFEIICIQHRFSKQINKYYKIRTWNNICSLLSISVNESQI